MLNKLKAIWGVFRKGEAVADPKAWKNGQVSVSMIAGLIVALVALAKAFNIDLPIDYETATTIAAGLLSIVNVVLTITSSDKVGLPAKQPSLPSVQQGAQKPAETEAVQEQHASDVAHQGIDDETRRRAEQYVKQATLNGLGNNDA